MLPMSHQPLTTLACSRLPWPQSRGQQPPAETSIRKSATSIQTSSTVMNNWTSLNSLKTESTKLLPFSTDSWQRDESTGLSLTFRQTYKTWRMPRVESLLDHSPTINLLTKSFQSMRLTLNESSIHEDHPLWHEVAPINTRIRSISTLEKAPHPTIIAAGPSTARTKTVQIPKMELPTFHGDLMQWATFRHQFSAAVDSHPDLTKANKLAYLQSAIKDPRTSPLMESGVEHEGRYDDVVALLHR